MIASDYTRVHATNLRDGGFTLNYTGTNGHADFSVTAIGMDSDSTDGVWSASSPQNEGYRLSAFNEITYQFTQQVRVRFDFQYTEDNANETYSLTVDGTVQLEGEAGDQVIECR